MSALSSDKSNRKRNNDNFFCRYCSKAHLPLTVKNSANFMPGT